MSYSGLWLIDKDYFGEETKKYGNSWLFSPIAWDTLLKKYIPSEESSFMATLSRYDGNKTDNMLNALINNSTEQADRVVWEISNQQVFFSEDKKFISDSIKRFFAINQEYCKNLIVNSERWNQIAEDIANIDEIEYPYFVFKNTSCDDNIEYWFTVCGEDDCQPQSLRDVETVVTEFVVINNETIVDFITNTGYLRGE